MEIFWRLVLGHLIGDFTLQTNYIAAWKRESVMGLLVHCLIHPFIYCILLWNYLGQVWLQVGPIPLHGWTCITIVFVGHFVEDLWRIWSVTKKGEPDNMFFYIFDQVVHYMIIFSVSPVVDGHQGKFGMISYPALSGILPGSAADSLSALEKFFTITHPEPWVTVGILFAIVTHFTTVSIYFIEKDFFGRQFPSDREKYIGIAERLLVMGCVLLPGKLWVAVIGFWLLRSAVYKVRNIVSFSWTNIVAGNATAVLCGAFARFLIY